MLMVSDDEWYGTCEVVEDGLECGRVADGGILGDGTYCCPEHFDALAPADPDARRHEGDEE